MATLRKKDLVPLVARTLGGSREQANAALNAVLSSIEGSVSRGDRIVLTGFGTFEPRTVKQRKVRGIRGGEVTIPEHTRVAFKPGSNMRVDR